MRHRPLIRISPSSQRRGVEFADDSVSLSGRYPRALIAAGGAPVVLPCEPAEELVAEWVRRCDGVMLTGGDDVEPSLYCDALAPALARTVQGVDPRRDALELLLVAEVFRQRKPLLAICRGHQLLNVALGGTLIVDIRRQLPQALDHHRLDRKDKIVHEVTLTPGSLLARVTGSRTLGVNSSHHQAVDRVAKPLRVTAVGPDGVIEAMELAPAAGVGPPFLLAVQFHPERLWERHAEHAALFRRFTRACAAQRK
ncbi:MAG: gamma-glutamyl-gamma-aminobutyrate hydrolase family protein [Verrucomicrobia bacterium]|nr:gamma-glutamyl-gamma-aminobutyrate hydrolase family protein [Verrucomicrobiota bacterium]